MAASITAPNVSLSVLKIPPELLQVMQKCEVTLFQLLTVSQTGLQKLLQPTTLPWKHDTVFGWIQDWRNNNKLIPVSTNLLVGEGTSTQKNPEAVDALPQSVERQVGADLKRSPKLVVGEGTSFQKNPETVPTEPVAPQGCVEVKRLPQLLATVEEGTSSQKNAKTTTSSSESVGIKPCVEVKRSPDEIRNDSLGTLEEQANGENAQESFVLLDGTEFIVEEIIAIENTAAVDASETDPQEGSSKSTNQESNTTILTPGKLEDLLKLTEEGKDIIERAKIGELSEAKQLQLAGIIAKNHLATKKKLHTEDLENYALAVTSLFKCERKENYFLAKGGDRRNNGGKIANKVGNIKQKKRKSDTQETEHAKTLRNATIDVPVQSPESIEALEWLTFNQSPWSMVVENWKTCFGSRKQHLQSKNCSTLVLTSFPHYKLPYGYQLVDIDYRLLGIGVANGLAKLNSQIVGIASFISKKATDPSAVPLIEHMLNNNINEDSKLCALLLGLNTVLSPIAAGSRYKPTICMAQEDTIVFVVSQEQIYTKLQCIYSSYAERKHPSVPKLVILGTGFRQIQGPFFVCYNDLCYELPSLARALDVLVKLTAVLDLPYSKISKLVWHFISSYVYGLQQKESYASINRLVNFLSVLDRQP